MGNSCGQSPIDDPEVDGEFKQELSPNMGCCSRAHRREMLAQCELAARASILLRQDTPIMASGISRHDESEHEGCEAALAAERLDFDREQYALEASQRESILGFWQCQSEEHEQKAQSLATHVDADIQEFRPEDSAKEVPACSKAVSPNKFQQKAPCCQPQEFRPEDSAKEVPACSKAMEPNKSQQKATVEDQEQDVRSQESHGTAGREQSPEQNVEEQETAPINSEEEQVQEFHGTVCLKIASGSMFPRRAESPMHSEAPCEDKVQDSKHGEPLQEQQTLDVPVEKAEEETHPVSAPSVNPGSQCEQFQNEVQVKDTTQKVEAVCSRVAEAEQDQEHQNMFDSCADEAVQGMHPAFVFSSKLESQCEQFQMFGTKVATTYTSHKVEAVCSEVAKAEQLLEHPTMFSSCAEGAVRETCSQSEVLPNPESQCNSPQFQAVQSEEQTIIQGQDTCSADTEAVEAPCCQVDEQRLDGVWMTPEREPVASVKSLVAKFLYDGFEIPLNPLGGGVFSIYLDDEEILGDIQEEKGGSCILHWSDGATWVRQEEKQDEFKFDTEMSSSSSSSTSDSSSTSSSSFTWEPDIDEYQVCKLEVPAQNDSLVEE